MSTDMDKTHRLTPSLQLLAGLSILIVFSSCGGYTSPGEKLQRAVFRYNNAVRWSNYAVAGEYIPPEERAEYLADRRDASNELRILEFNIDEVRHANLASKAEVLVTFRWVQPASNIVNNSTFTQHWHYGENKIWLLKKRVLTKRKQADSIEERL